MTHTTLEKVEGYSGYVPLAGTILGFVGVMLRVGSIVPPAALAGLELLSQLAEANSRGLVLRASGPPNCRVAPGRQDRAGQRKAARPVFLRITQRSFQ